MAADDLQSNGQAVLSKASRYGSRRLTRHIEGKSKRQPLERRNDLPINLLDTLDMQGKGRNRECGCQQQIIVRHEFRRLVGNGLARHQGIGESFRGPRRADEIHKMWRHVMGMLIGQFA